MTDHSDALPKGITVKSNGDFRVTVYPVGSTNPVRVTFKTLPDALEALAHGLRARENGEDLDGVKAAMVAGVQAARRPAHVAVRTMGELMDEFLKERQAICDLGNHRRRRSLKKGVNSVRPRTMTNYRTSIRRHLRPRWGDVPVDQIDRSSVNSWMIDLAEQGMSLGTASAQLILLRALMKLARRSEAPDDFPWADVAAIQPRQTIRPSRDPEKWGGTPTSKPPVTPIAETITLLSLLPAATRGALLSERFAGFRVGEACGLMLTELRYDDYGVLRATIRRQMDDRGRLLDYVKTDASYRTIPLPRHLASFLDEYCRFYHGYDLHRPDPAMASRLVFVNRAGRDLDGSFLPIRPTSVYQQLIEAREHAGLTHAELGFTMANHHFRECFTTEMLNATTILESLEGNQLDGAPTDPSARVAYLENLLIRRQNVEFSPMHVSSYAGHEHDGSSEKAGAANVTLRHYNLSLNNDAPWLAICAATDRLIDATIGTLHFTPDEDDLLPVHQIDDPEWCTVAEAVELIGIQDSNVIAAINDGRIEGHLGWQANGGYQRNLGGEAKTTPAHPQLFTSRVSVKEFIRKKNLVGTATAASRMGVTDRTAAAILRLAGAEPEGTKWNPDAVEATVRRMHMLVLEALGSDTLSLSALKRRIDLTTPTILPDRKVLPSWLERWCAQLVGRGEIHIGKDGRVTPTAARPACPHDPKRPGCAT